MQAPPGGLSNSLEGLGQLSVGNVTCLSNADCIAAGYLQVANPAADSYPPKVPQSFYHPLLWHWDGHSWAFQGSGTQGSVGLVGSACASPTDCWAVGGQFVGKLGNQSVGVIIHFDGKSWSPSLFPSPAGAAFNGVACPSAADCLVVGNRQTSADAAHVMAETWDGKSWKTMSAPSPKGALWSVLESLTCSSATRCLALGDADNSTKGPGYFFAEQFDGTSWSIVADQDAAEFNMGNDSGLFEISCPSEDDCLAVGSAARLHPRRAGGRFPRWSGGNLGRQVVVRPQANSPRGRRLPRFERCLLHLGEQLLGGDGLPRHSWPDRPRHPPRPLGRLELHREHPEDQRFLGRDRLPTRDSGPGAVASGEAPGQKTNSAVMTGGDFLTPSGPVKGAPKS